MHFWVLAGCTYADDRASHEEIDFVFDMCQYLRMDNLICVIMFISSLYFLLGMSKRMLYYPPMYAWNHLGATAYEGSDCRVLAVCTFGFWLDALTLTTGRLTKKSILFLICVSIFEWTI